MHTYQRDPQSGAGNCVCAFSENSAVHPHAFTQSARSERCVCTRPAGGDAHADAATAIPPSRCELALTVCKRQSGRLVAGTPQCRSRASPDG